MLSHAEWFPFMPESAEESAIGFHLVKSNSNDIEERGVIVLTMPSSTFPRFDQVYDSGSQWYLMLENLCNGT